MKVDLILTCTATDITPVSYKEIHVQMEDVDVAEILGYIPISDAIDCYDAEKLLDEIGVDKVKAYFQLQDIKQ